jgi:hypothetical protein
MATILNAKSANSSSMNSNSGWADVSPYRNSHNLSIRALIAIQSTAYPCRRANPFSQWEGVKAWSASQVSYHLTLFDCMIVAVWLAKPPPDEVV